MVGTRTRSTRKRRAVNDNDEGEGAEDDHHSSMQHAEAALQRAEQAIKKKQKLRRAEAFARYHPPFELLPPLAIELVFLFLDSSKDVRNLAYLAKYLLECVTPEIVIRSAVFGGGTTRAAIGSIVSSVQNKSIHIPSTLRLLRLVSATMCERGDQCFGYNLETQVPEKMPKTSWRPFGLMLCPSCFKGNSLNVHYSLINDINRLEVDSNKRLLLFPHKETATGVATGPLVLAHQAQQIQATHKSNPDAMKQAFATLFESIDKKTPEADTVRALTICSSYQVAESQYDDFLASKHRVIRKKYEEKASKRTANRLKNAKAVYAQLESLLEDYEHKELVLACTWDEGYCYFNHMQAETVFGPLVRAPSTATKVKLVAATSAIREVLQLLQSYGFSGPQFLSFLSTCEQSHEKLLYRFCVARLSGDRLKDMVERYSSSAFAALLRDDKPFEALLHLLPASQLSAAFCQVVQERDPTRRENLMTLAEKIWSRKDPILVQTQDAFKTKVSACRREYKNLVSSIDAYLLDPQVVQFLAETGPPALYPGQVFSRREAVDKMYEHASCLRFLESRSFASMLSLHKAFFQNPSYYGFY